jgi:sugar phosphate permease
MTIVSKCHAEDRINRPGYSPAFATIFVALSILLIVGQLHRSSGGVLLPALAGTMPLSLAQLASIVSAMFLAHGLSQIPAGIALDRYGPRIVIALLALVAALGSWVFAESHGAGTLGLGRAMLGAGFAATVMGSFVLLTNWVPPEKFSTMSGRVLFIGGMGGLLATTPLAMLIEAIGWRATFHWLAAITLAGGIVAWLVIRDRPADATAALAAKATPPATFAGVIKGWAAVVRDRRIWPILIVGFVLYSPQQVLLGLWAGPFLDDIHHLGAVPRSHILLAMAIATTVGSLAFGPVERRLDVRRPLVLGSMALVSALFALLALFSYASLWQSALIFCAISLVAPFYIVTLSHALALFPQPLSGRVISTVNMTCVIGVVLVQNLTGIIVAAIPQATGATPAEAYRWIFGTMAALLAAAMLVYSTTAEVRPSAARPLAAG